VWSAAIGRIVASGILIHAHPQSFGGRGHQLADRRAPP
jgi:hypothetical protein